MAGVEGMRKGWGRRGTGGRHARGAQGRRDRKSGGGELQDQHRRRLRGVRLEGQAGLGSQGAWGDGRTLGCALSVIGSPGRPFSWEC